MYPQIFRIMFSCKKINGVNITVTIITNIIYSYIPGTAKLQLKSKKGVKIFIYI